MGRQSCLGMHRPRALCILPLLRPAQHRWTSLPIRPPGPRPPADPLDCSARIGAAVGVVARQGAARVPGGGLALSRPSASVWSGPDPGRPRPLGSELRWAQGASSPVVLYPSAPFPTPSLPALVSQPAQPLPVWCSGAGAGRLFAVPRAREAVGSA